MPIWYGGAPVPSEPVVRRIGRFCDGWFVLCAPEDYPDVRARVNAAAADAGRDGSSITLTNLAPSLPPQALLENLHQTIKGFQQKFILPLNLLPLAASSSLPRKTIPHSVVTSLMISLRLPRPCNTLPRPAFILLIYTPRKLSRESR